MDVLGPAWAVRESIGMIIHSLRSTNDPIVHCDHYAAHSNDQDDRIDPVLCRLAAFAWTSVGRHQLNSFGVSPRESVP